MKVSEAMRAERGSALWNRTCNKLPLRRAIKLHDAHLWEKSEKGQEAIAGIVSIEMGNRQADETARFDQLWERIENENLIG